jgi:hypothetical protein
MECYHTHQGDNIPSKMWSMQQRLHRLNKFLGQGLGSAQTISRWFNQRNLYTDQGFSDNYNKMVSPMWDEFKLDSYSTLGIRMISAYQTKFYS